jgi:hypothetical protein
MYRAGRHNIRERIIAVEVMKLERQQTARRGGDERAYLEQTRSVDRATELGKRARGG